jgi:hypothetical protein
MHRSHCVGVVKAAQYCAVRQDALRDGVLMTREIERIEVAVSRQQKAMYRNGA